MLILSPLIEIMPYYQQIYLQHRNIPMPRETYCVTQDHGPHLYIGLGKIIEKNMQKRTIFDCLKEQKNTYFKWIASKQACRTCKPHLENQKQNIEGYLNLAISLVDQKQAKLMRNHVIFLVKKLFQIIKSFQNLCVNKNTVKWISYKRKRKEESSEQSSEQSSGQISSQIQQQEPSLLIKKEAVEIDIEDQEKLQHQQPSQEILPEMKIQHENSTRKHRAQPIRKRDRSSSSSSSQSPVKAKLRKTDRKRKRKMRQSPSRSRSRN